MLLNKFNNPLPINDNDNQPINVIKITDMIISSPGILYGK